MKYVFQLVRAETGVRSPSFITTREQLAELLANGGKEKVGANDEDLVLVLGDVDDQDEFGFNQAPLMRVDTFISQFGVRSDEPILHATA